jgi:hypothetical protein
MLLKVDKTKNPGKISFTLLCNKYAEVADLADALGSGLSEHYARVGSSPTFGTGINPAPILQGFLFPLREARGWSKMEL